jgi:hypothetical protein
VSLRRLAYSGCGGQYHTGFPEPRTLMLVSIRHKGEMIMGKGILLWLIGVPIPVILILWFIFR